MNNSWETNSGSSVIRPVTGRLMYLLAIIAFFFTFFNLRCGTAKLANVSGLNMAIGGKAKMRSDFLSKWLDVDAIKTDSAHNVASTIFGKKKDRDIPLPVNYWALGAIVCIILALIASVFHKTKAYLVQMGLAGGATLSLVLMLLTKSQYAMRIMNLDRDSPFAGQSSPFGDQVFGLQIAWAFWLALAALVVAIFVAMVMLRRLKIELENEAALELLGEKEENDWERT